jgi:hypothetical protein
LLTCRDGMKRATKPGHPARQRRTLLEQTFAELAPAFGLTMLVARQVDLARMRRRVFKSGALDEDLQLDAAVRKLLLGDRIPLLACGQTALLNRVTLEQPIQFLRIAPEGTSIKPTN